MQRILTAILILSFAACSEEPPPPKPKKAPEPPPVAKKTPPPPPPVDPPKPTPAPKVDVPAVLLDPTLPEWSKTAPATYKAKFVTSKGDFTIEVTREWAPQGADRFYNLVRNGFFDGVCFFRVISNFMAQFGINGSPDVSTKWRTAKIPDDPVTQSNTRGMITFATSGKNSRTTQVFINFKDNSALDSQGFSPFGKVTEGMEIVDAIYNGYGEGAPRGSGPRQDLVQTQGNEYLKAEFPKLDFVKTARIVE